MQELLLLFVSENEGYQHGGRPAETISWTSSLRSRDLVSVQKQCPKRRQP